MAKSEIIGANHFEFAKFLFQQYSQQLGLNNNHFSVELAFNFYVNDKITDCLEGTQKKIANTSGNTQKDTTTHLEKTKIEAPTNPLYHYTPESAINILSADAFTLNMTLIFE
ncbi:hypothetical protein G9A89_004376 [Geosiphon pyriformis]|nr:hypothetical protein G9A89_004376 [Geosiphon pyriformis]